MFLKSWIITKINKENKLQKFMLKILYPQVFLSFLKIYIIIIKKWKQ